MSSLSETWLKEKETIDNYRKTNSELFEISEIPEKDLLPWIGVSFISQTRPEGYIRFYPPDFIVEEISETGEISEIEPKERKISPFFPFHLGCDLIKAGISTFDALNLLANALEIKVGRITYAGLKDVNALTSQKLIFLDLAQETFEKIKKISLPHLFLSNFNIEKKALLKGDLLGNRFSLFLRTKEGIEQKLFSQNIVKIEKEGFLNFYSVQRFGTPRFISHYLGKLILQGKYQEVIFDFLTKTGLQEIPLIKEIRGRAERFFGNWGKVEKIFSEFPFTFRNELQLLTYLKDNPRDYTGALIFFKDQTKFWLYSYASYLFNKILSLEGLKLPEKIPLLLSNELKDTKVYQFWLEKHGTQNFKRNIRPFRFLKLERRFVKTRIFPQKVLFKILPEGVTLSFILEKGVYATTFLMNLFEIKEGLPLPVWVKSKEYDIKKLLGLGSIKTVKKFFGDVVLTCSIGLK